MFSQLISKLIFAPGKLPDTFPWTVQTAGKKYFVALLHFVVGSFLVPFLFFGGIFVVIHYPSLLANPVVNSIVGFMADASGKPNMTFVMVLSLVSFIMGFGMQVRYIAGQMRKDGLSLAKAMALTFAPLKGKWWGGTAFNVFLPVAIAYGLTQLAGESVVHLLGPAHQPTVDLARAATGGNFLLFALMAVLGAPIFEEIVFRGFLFQVIRCSLRREPQALVLRTVPELGFCRVFIIAANWVRGRSFVMTAYLHKVLGGKRADFSAVILSSLMFSLMHMQFQPTTLVLLFLLGCVQAELYRRTGSLYCGMILHAVNNGIDVLKLAIGG